ncbi:FixH family protein [Inquilinus sp. OTU3971]|uniref:FixH family protein n=1 Tax=Inquilinus sp. OTU3971 TaxID=3043855 RepID=UPI00313A8D18
MIASATMPRRGRWIPWIFVLGFFVMLGANGGLIYFARQSWVGLAYDRPYERGLAYNALLAEADREAALGWTVAIARQDYRDRTLMLALHLTGKEAALPDGEVEARLVRPIEGDAVTLEPVPIREGRVLLAAGGLRPGLWDLRLTIRRGEAVMHTDRRLILR